jgi:hypothetical protein
MPAPSTATSLVNLVLALLTPMFLWSTAGDIRLAQIAAAETLNDYGVTNRLSLLAVAKIIAFDIATLSSLSLSMGEDVSILLALRLRGNANSLDRSGERNRRALEAARQSVSADEPIEAAVAQAEQMVREAKARVHASQPQPVEAPPPAAPAPNDTAAPEPHAGTPAARPNQQQAAWADAMTRVAEELTTGLKDLPPDQRRHEMARIKALTTAAGDLSTGSAPPPVPAMAA